MVDIKLHTGVALTFDKIDRKRFKELDATYGEKKVSKAFDKITDSIFAEILSPEVIDAKFSNIVDRLEKELA